MTNTTYIVQGTCEFGNPAGSLIVKDVEGNRLGQVQYAAVPLHAGSDVAAVLAAVSHILPRGTRRVENVGRLIHVVIQSD